jgi:uncharacterized membrane protein YcaP (DUF421 family)
MPDLAAMFGVSLSPLELMLRGSAMYWALFLLFRFVLRRDAGALGIADILLLVLIADASQNAMSGGYTSVGEGLILVGTIAFWSWLTDWAAYRWPAARRFADPAPLVLVRRGRLHRGNLRREMVTVPELMAALREHGIDKLADVKMARIEPDGMISVIRYPPTTGGDDVGDDARRARRAVI